jgi:CAAX prenyl protease-like protein
VETKPEVVSTAPTSRPVEQSALPYVLPFVFFIGLLAASDYLALLGRWEFPARVTALAVLLYAVSRHVIDFRCRVPVQSIGIGILVFAIWVAPDLLIPGWRNHWLFQNGVMGKLKTSIPSNLLDDPLVLSFRTIRAAVLVPIIEELFWRAWLMRWLINPKFYELPLGAYQTGAFWITALLFASEHGPYWEVGLLAGIIYNWWMVRTRSLGDLILAHGVTNLVLSLYTIATKRWEYWL